MNEIAPIHAQYEFNLPSESFNIRPHFDGPKSVRAVEEYDRIQKVSGHKNRPGMAGCDIKLHLHRVYALLQTKLNGQDFVTTANNSNCKQQEYKNANTPGSSERDYTR